MVYELNHLFYRHGADLVSSPKNLGLYPTAEAAREAMSYFCTQSGFRENPDGFSVRLRLVSGPVRDDLIYEAMVYFYTEDYGFEEDLELGLFGCEDQATGAVEAYCTQNPQLLAVPGLICERIVNRCFLGRRRWEEGFVVLE